MAEEDPMEEPIELHHEKEIEKLLKMHYHFFSFSEIGRTKCESSRGYCLYSNVSFRKFKEKRKKKIIIHQKHPFSTTLGFVVSHVRLSATATESEREPHRPSEPCELY